MDAGGENSKLVDQSEGHHQQKNQRRRHHHNHHKGQFLGQAGRVGLLFGLIVAVFFVIYHFQFSSQSSYSNQTELSLSLDERITKLKGILEKAATTDKTVIITTLNAAWAAPNSIFDLFLESFRIGNQTRRLLNHLIVVSWDQKAYDRCLTLHLHCHDLSNGKDFSGEAFYMSTIYLEMCWRRIHFLGSVLQLGYNFIFTDTDIMWFRDPFPHFYSDGDFQIACDFMLSNATSIDNRPNGGFKYVKSNKYTINFYKIWYDSRKKFPGIHDQDVLNTIKYHPDFNKIGIKMLFLDTTYFGGFCESSKDLNQICTVHANCCVGLDSKVHDLKVILDDWRKYLSLPTNVRASKPKYWSFPQECRKSLSKSKK